MMGYKYTYKLNQVDKLAKFFRLVINAPVFSTSQEAVGYNK
jgi:hypothetical protein